MVMAAAAGAGTGSVEDGLAAGWTARPPVVIDRLVGGIADARRAEREAGAPAAP